VANMRELFKDHKLFNDDIRGWNVSQVTDMSDMFYGAASFNQAIGRWDVSQVGDVKFMFYGASAFNQPLEQWNVGKVTTMEHMFYGASAFNQDIGEWDVSNVTDMTNMFNESAYTYGIPSVEDSKNRKNLSMVVSEIQKELDKAQEKLDAKKGIGKESLSSARYGVLSNPEMIREIEKNFRPSDSSSGGNRRSNTRKNRSKPKSKRTQKNKVHEKRNK